MSDEKDTKKLNAEELEKRVAPLALTVTDPTQDPGTTSQGGGWGKPAEPKVTSPGGGGDGTGGGGKVYVP